MAIPVKLPVFEGPLDLLMHLIEKNKIDIYDIPIVEITDQYLEYVHQMDHEDMDVTSEFLVMAATLLDIKSRMLLPREKNEETGEEEGDPREELVQRLLEYKMYKYLSEELAVRREESGVRFFRAQKLPKEVRNYQPPIDYSDLLKDTDLKSLEKVFGEVLRRKKSRRDPIRSGFGKIRREQVSMDTKSLYIRAYLQSHPQTDFRALLESQESREEVIVTFLILLELMKTQKVHIVQDSIGGKILVEAGKQDEPEETAEAVPDETAEPEENTDTVSEDTGADTEAVEENTETVSIEERGPEFFSEENTSDKTRADEFAVNTASPLRALRALLARRSAEVTAPFTPFNPLTAAPGQADPAGLPAPPVPFLTPAQSEELVRPVEQTLPEEPVQPPVQTSSPAADVIPETEATDLPEEALDTAETEELPEEALDTAETEEALDIADTEELPEEALDAAETVELPEEAPDTAEMDELPPSQHFSAHLWHGRCPEHAPGYVPCGTTAGAAHYRGFRTGRTGTTDRYSGRAVREQNRLSRLWARRRM